MAKAQKPKATEASTPLAGGGRASVAATPSITSPLANSFVLPNTDLLVTITTNRTDLDYVVEFTDLTPPVAPAVVQNVPAPGVSPFMVTIPGANLGANQTYSIHVSVAAGNWPPPDHLDHSLNVHTNVQPDDVMLTMGLLKKKKK